jgi:hypothetical protein
VVVVQVNALAGHKTQAGETNEYPIIHEVGILAEVVHAKAPVAVHAAQRVVDPIKEYPG